LTPDPLDLIRMAVLQAADEGADPARVSALLLRISAEVAVTTSSVDSEQWKALSEMFWYKSEQEYLCRSAEKKAPGEA
jgi:hypothetical protein